jgi:hypothetical protein
MLREGAESCVLVVRDSMPGTVDGVSFPRLPPIDISDSVEPAMGAGDILDIQQGSTLRAVRLPGTTESRCRASRFPCKLARRTIKYFDKWQ